MLFGCVTDVEWCREDERALRDGFSSGSTAAPYTIIHQVSCHMADTTAEKLGHIT